MSFSAHNVVSLFRARHPVRDWDNSELAQFYRVEAALRQAGIFVDTERGVTDEGDPWFVYCREDSGDVFLHIARFDGLYMAASPSMPFPIVRKKFDELLGELVRENPVILAPSPNRRPGPDLFIHPSTMLIAAVAALGEMKACDAVPALAEALLDKSAIVAQQANKSLRLITERDTELSPQAKIVERRKVRGEVLEWWGRHEAEVRTKLGQPKGGAPPK